MSQLRLNSEGSRSPPKTDCPVRIIHQSAEDIIFCCNAINLRSAGHQILMMFHTANMLGQHVKSDFVPQAKKPLVDLVMKRLIILCAILSICLLGPV